MNIGFLKGASASRTEIDVLFLFILWVHDFAISRMNYTLLFPLIRRYQVERWPRELLIQDFYF